MIENPVGGISRNSGQLLSRGIFRDPEQLRQLLSMGMNVNLTAVTGARPVTIALRLPTVIGRSASAKVQVRQASVSRKHCALYTEGDRLYVLDLGSSNGTFVNGSRVNDARPIEPGDLLRIGKVTFRIDADPASAVVAASSSESPSPADIEPDTAPRDSEQEEAVLQYCESEQGSFVAIDTGEMSPESVDDFPELEGAPRVTPVDDDSALGRFLKGLS